ncbi:MAG TPA: protein kinase [Gaiellaceae bacterium]|nr:protein kinase [Gaiellaceae bacterium]
MAHAPVSGDLIAGRYELEELVGSGGMSSVFRAHDRQLDRRVAIKLLHQRYAGDDEQVERFRREARAVAQLSHPNIVTVIDRGEDEGRQFIVFEYVDGENLKELVVRAGRLPLRRALELGLAVADGLAFAHENGLVHRDVKPQNVLLSGEGEVKVTDFGIARSLDVDHGMTQTGTVLGTSNYLSPEQAGGRGVSPATDVYSLGIVLWELLAGEVPFPGDNFVTVALRHINEQPPDLRAVRRDVSPRLAAAVARALEKEPRRRFPSMADFAAELRACLAELEEEDTASRPVADAPPAVAHPRRRRRWRPLAYLLAALAVAAAAFAGVVLLGGSGHRNAGTGNGPPAAGGAVALRGVGDYDPQGDGGELSDTAPRATDGSAATYWATEHYATQDWGNLKDGLGLVLDAGSTVELARLTVTTTPAGSGFVARVEVGASEQGPFAVDSSTKTVGARTTFTLHGKSGRYWVVWLTRLGPQRTAQISEVTATR